VVKAGLVPALRRGRLDNSDEWFFAEMVPGTHPLENLVATLRGLATRLPDNLHEQLQANPQSLLSTIHGLLPDPQSQLLLVRRGLHRRRR
jgi:hypothetical protein